MKKDFLNDVKNHKLEIKKNDGIYRHLRFKNPDSYNMYFELITWPGYLVITGDMGEYMFCRTNDMFDFFKRDDLSINIGYWAEKCTAENCMSGNGKKEWSDEDFKATIRSHFDYYFEDSDLNEEKIAEIWQDIDNNVLSASGEIECIAALLDFHNNDYDISEAYDHGNFERYTYHFTWCLYAIVWGIYQFNKQQ